MKYSQRAQGKSRGRSPSDFSRAQAIFYCISRLRRVDSPYWPGGWGYIFLYCPVEEAIRVRIGPAKNFAVEALGNTDSQESNTRRVFFFISIVSFLVIEKGLYCKMSRLCI